ncbi:Reverse transcriptase-like, partial [Sesbania bispinosa]
AIKDDAKYFEKIKWSHIYREANSCADLLANHGHSLDVGVQVYNNAPAFLVLALIADWSAVHFSRG